MKIKAFLLPLLCCALSSFSLPEFLDYSKVKPGSCDNLDQDYWSAGFLAFNGAPEISSVFIYLKDVCGLTAAVETGTFEGNTTSFFSHLFNEVHTIELKDTLHERALQDFASSPHVHCHLGNSDDVLKELLPTLADQTVLFYLDAHWDHYWPLRNEILEISKTHYDNCVIVVDDFHVPGRHDIPFDQYGGNSCSYNYIKDQLDQAFSEYTIHYVIPTNVRCRAKFVAVPTRLVQNK